MAYGSKPHLIDIKRICDLRGNLAVIESPGSLPFAPVRCYWLNDIPAGENREGHAYHRTAELIVLLSGSFTVATRDACGTREDFRMTRPDTGLLVPPGIWRQLIGFTTNATALIVASTPYDPDDYIRDFATFLKTRTE